MAGGTIVGIIPENKCTTTEDTDTNGGHRPSLYKKLALLCSCLCPVVSRSPARFQRVASRAFSSSNHRSTTTRPAGDSLSPVGAASLIITKRSLSAETSNGRGPGTPK